MSRKKPAPAQPSQWYAVRAIIDRKGSRGSGKFLVEWEGTKENGEKWESSWVPENEVTQDLVKEWWDAQGLQGRRGVKKEVGAEVEGQLLGEKKVGGGRKGSTAGKKRTTSTEAPRVKQEQIEVKQESRSLSPSLGAASTSATTSDVKPSLSSLAVSPSLPSHAPPSPDLQPAVLEEAAPTPNTLCPSSDFFPLSFTSPVRFSTAFDTFLDSAIRAGSKEGGGGAETPLILSSAPNSPRLGGI